MTLTAPCDWPTASCPQCDGSDCLSPAQQDDLIAWAISDLWLATGRVYGTCPVSVLPCNSSVCGLCRNSLRSCGCRNVPEIRLPGPVHSVIEVVIDGVALDSTDYRIDDYEWLVRLDGGSWPTNTDPVDPDAFRVEYKRGIPPPAGAGAAVGRLVCSRGNCQNGTCKIPKNTTQVSRQGVTMVRDIEATVFGVREVDDWVRSANAPIRAGAVHSPDIPHVREITWQSAGSP